MKLIIAKGVFKDIYYWGQSFASMEASAKWDAFWAREMVESEYIVLGPDNFAGRDFSIYSVEPKAAKEVANGKLG